MSGIVKKMRKVMGFEKQFARKATTGSVGQHVKTASTANKLMHPQNMINHSEIKVVRRSVKVTQKSEVTLSNV